jgi:hypothetical protein
MSQVSIGVISGLALLAGLTLLSGCHKKPEKAPPPAVVAPAPVVVPKPSPPRPPRKPGLWQTTLSEEGSPERPEVFKICIDALTDQRLGILGTDLSGDTCASKTFSPQGEGNWGVLAECNMGAGVVTEYSGSVTGDFNSHYEMNVRSQTTGGSQMNRVTSYIVSSKRLGACTAGQKPGDVINNGVKMNLFGMAGGNPEAKVQASEAPPPDVVD